MKHFSLCELCDRNLEEGSFTGDREVYVRLSSGNGCLFP